MKVVILSKGRSKTIAKNSLRLFPRALVTVDEREVADYNSVVPRDQLVPHPPLRFVAEIRNWVIDNIKDNEIVMADDDCTFLMSKTGLSPRRYIEPAVIEQVFENSSECAKGFGCSLFGWSHMPNPIYQYMPNDPIYLDEWVSTVFGIIGKDYHFDEEFKYAGEDIDFSLQHLMKERIIFVDTRFHFAVDNVPGGQDANRSLERDKADREYLLRKWGKFVSAGFKDSDHGRVHANSDGLGPPYKSVHVARRQGRQSWAE